MVEALLNISVLFAAGLWVMCLLIQKMERSVINQARPTQHKEHTK